MALVLDGALARLGRQRWLDPVADRVQHSVAGAFARGGKAGLRLRDVLHGTWLGHPLHPPITDVPVGAWTAAAIFDAMDAARGRDELAPAADLSIMIGLVGAMGAAVTGLTDWHHTTGTARRMGLVHGQLNSIAALLYVASLMMRRRGARGAGRSASMLAYGIASISAYIGGHLVFGEQIGVNRATAPRSPDQFVAVLSDSDLRENEPRRAEVDGLGVVLVRSEGRVSALVESCAHLGGPLAEGSVEDGAIVCPWHGSRFGLKDGRVLNGPSTYRQPCLDVRVQNGTIEVRAPGRR